MLPQEDEDLLRDLFGHGGVAEDAARQTEHELSVGLIGVGQGGLLARRQPGRQLEVVDPRRGCPLPVSLPVIHRQDRTERAGPVAARPVGSAASSAASGWNLGRARRRHAASRSPSTPTPSPSRSRSPPDGRWPRAGSLAGSRHLRAVACDQSTSVTRGQSAIAACRSRAPDLLDRSMLLCRRSRADTSASCSVASRPSVLRAGRPCSGPAGTGSGIILERSTTGRTPVDAGTVPDPSRCGRSRGGVDGDRPDGSRRSTRRLGARCGRHGRSPSRSGPGAPRVPQLLVRLAPRARPAAVRAPGRADRLHRLRSLRQARPAVRPAGPRRCRRGGRRSSRPRPRRPRDPRHGRLGRGRTARSRPRRATLGSGQPAGAHERLDLPRHGAPHGGAAARCSLCPTSATSCVGADGGSAFRNGLGGHLLRRSPGRRRRARLPVAAPRPSERVTR